MAIRLLLLLSILFSSASFAREDYGIIDANATEVALFQAIGFPEKYDRKNIRVFGIYHWSIEGSYLFLTRDHYDAFDTASALELAVGEKFLPTEIFVIKRIEGRPVVLEGTLLATEGLGGRPLLMPITRMLAAGRSRSAAMEKK
tara:strand:- start:289 stop:720 length:432 start_codon:yes stop_codon:yes gene_type:complete